jgi:hypothetical protein
MNPGSFYVLFIVSNSSTESQQPSHLNPDLYKFGQAWEQIQNLLFLFIFSPSAAEPQLLLNLHLEFLKVGPGWGMNPESFHFLFIFLDSTPESKQRLYFKSCETIL